MHMSAWFQWLLWVPSPVGYLSCPVTQLVASPFLFISISVIVRKTDEEICKNVCQLYTQVAVTYLTSKVLQVQLLLLFNYPALIVSKQVRNKLPLSVSNETSGKELLKFSGELFFVSLSHIHFVLLLLSLSCFYVVPSFFLSNFPSFAA
jgi:hypothetical protein